MFCVFGHLSVSSFIYSRRHGRDVGSILRSGWLPLVLSSESLYIFLRSERSQPDHVNQGDSKNVQTYALCRVRSCAGWMQLGTREGNGVLHARPGAKACGSRAMDP